MTPDVNVLVAASRSDHPHHRIARSWLEDAASAAASGATLVLMPMVLASFVRLVSSPKIFQYPTPVDDALAFVDALLAAQGVHLATLGPEWPRLRQLSFESSALPITPEEDEETNPGYTVGSLPVGSANKDASERLDSGVIDDLFFGVLPPQLSLPEGPHQVCPSAAPGGAGNSAPSGNQAAGPPITRKLRIIVYKKDSKCY
jgi:toxin-antitoxin system PIN domain toxin